MVRLFRNHYASGSTQWKEFKHQMDICYLEDSIEVEVLSSVQNIKIKNTKNEWNIQNAGGIVPIIFI